MSDSLISNTFPLLFLLIPFFSWLVCLLFCFILFSFFSSLLELVSFLSSPASKKDSFSPFPHSFDLPPTHTHPWIFDFFRITCLTCTQQQNLKYLWVPTFTSCSSCLIRPFTNTLTPTINTSIPLHDLTHSFLLSSFVYFFFFPSSLRRHSLLYPSLPLLWIASANDLLLYLYLFPFLVK